MSVTEILEELPKLKDEERHLLLERLNELEMSKLEKGPGIEITFEMVAAINEGIRSLEEHGGIPAEVVWARLEAKFPFLSPTSDRSQSLERFQ